MAQLIPAVISSVVTVVKNNRDTTAEVANESELAAARYVLLLHELKKEKGGEYGWQSAVARDLGVTQSYVSRLLSRERASIGLDVIERACKRLKLKRDFFHGPTVPRSYRDYLRNDDDAPYGAWEDFVATPDGKSMTAGERSTIASMRFEDREPSVIFYRSILMSVRGMLPLRKVDAVVDENERLSRENSHDRGPRRPR